MAVKYSVGVSSTSRDRSLLKRRRTSSTRLTAVQRATGEGTEIAAPAKRGWVLLTQQPHVDEPEEPSASWAW